MAKPGAAKEALPLKFTASPGQIFAGAPPTIEATAVGRAQGTVQLMLAAKLPRSASFECHTTVRQPVEFEALAEITCPCSVFPVQVPSRGALVLSPS